MTREKRSVLIPVLAAVVVYFGMAAGAKAVMPPDLKLKDTPESKVVVQPQPNPHERPEQCPTCHGESSLNYLPWPIPPVEEFLSDDYPDALCYDCHKGWSELHPTRI